MLTATPHTQPCVGPCPLRHGPLARRPAQLPSVRVSAAPARRNPNIKRRGGGPGGRDSKPRPRGNKRGAVKERQRPGTQGREGSHGGGVGEDLVTGRVADASGLDELARILNSGDPPGHRSGYVTLLGKPNAGKSTMLNAMLGQKLSIVTYKAQTTRHRILGIVSDDDFQMVLYDTPGVILDKRNKLEERMMSAVRDAINDADVLLAVIDSDARPKEVLGMIQLPEGWKGAPMAVVLNKCDLLGAAEVDDLEAWYKEHCRCEKVFKICAKTGEGVEAVKQWAIARLPEGPTFYPKDQVTEHPERFFVSEIMREKLFLMYRQEIPYGLAVNIEDFKERASGKDYVKMQVICENDRQKGILLGKGGSALKALNTAARLDIEKFLQRPVYLEVQIKVSEKWRETDNLLTRFGY